MQLYEYIEILEKHPRDKILKKAFFGLWYNFNNIDGCTTGIYDTEEQARHAIAIHSEETEVEILNA